MDRLSDEKRAEIEEAFRLFDNNGNGELSRNVWESISYKHYVTYEYNGRQYIIW